MAQTAATATIPADLTALYDQLKTLLLPDTSKIDYQPKSRAELRAGLEESLMPTYQAAVRERQQNTQRTNASVDADAAARGIGASTYGTDVKNRNYGTEANDIATMRGNYNSTLANNLNSMMSDQEDRKLSADQYNKSAESGTLSNALSMALSNYGKWGTTQEAGGGGSPSRNPEPTVYTDKEYLDMITKKNPYAYTTSYDQRAKSAQSALDQEIIRKYRTTKYGNSSQILSN